MSYHLYILACADDSLYTGIATDVVRRVREHNGETARPVARSAATRTAARAAVKGKGARYTATRRPVRLVYQAEFATRSEALKAEIRIKRLTRGQKQQLIANNPAVENPAGEPVSMSLEPVAPAAAGTGRSNRTTAS